jgi:uncharacterized membrane protein
MISLGDKALPSIASAFEKGFVGLNSRRSFSFIAAVTRSIVGMLSKLLVSVSIFTIGFDMTILPPLKALSVICFLLCDLTSAA